MSVNVGETISTTMRMTLERIGSLAGLWGVFFIAQIALLMVVSMVVGAGALAFAGLGDPSAAAFGGLGIGMIFTLIVMYAGYFLLYGAQSIAMTTQASPLVEPNFGQSFTTGLRGSFTFLGVAVLLIIAYFLAALVVGIAVAALSFLGESAALILALLVVPVVIYLACRLMVIPAVIGVEQTFNPITALRRTWELTRGNVLGIFLVLLVYMVLLFIVLGVVVLIIGGGAMSLASGLEEASVGMIVFLLIAVFVLSVAFAAISSAMIAALHAAVSDNNAGQISDTFS